MYGRAAEKQGLKKKIDTACRINRIIYTKEEVKIPLLFLYALKWLCEMYKSETDKLYIRAKNAIGFKNSLDRRA